MSPEYRASVRRLNADSVLAGHGLADAASLAWIAEGRSWSSALGLSLAIAGAVDASWNRLSPYTQDALLSFVIAGSEFP